MNRSLAMVLLALMVIGLIFSIYASFQGRFTEALMVYPLLIAAWVFSRIGSKGEK